MSTLTPYNGLQVVTPDPTGDGGLAINNNFKMTSTNLTTTDPNSTDKAPDFLVGCRWINTTSGTEFVCTDDSTPVWLNLSSYLPLSGGTLTGNLNLGSHNITNVGTITAGTWNGATIAVAYGGTGATTAAAARSNLSAAQSGANTDITSLGAFSLTGNMTIGTKEILGGMGNLQINATGSGDISCGVFNASGLVSLGSGGVEAAGGTFQINGTTGAVTVPSLNCGSGGVGLGTGTISAATGNFVINGSTGAVTAPNFTTPNSGAGGVATGFLLVQGLTSGSLKITTADATAQALTLKAAAQTSGAATLTIPDQAGVNRNFVTDTGTQTLSNKTLTAPIVAVLKPASDSTTAVAVTKADGTTGVLVVDTTNSRLGIGKNPSSDSLDINGGIAASGQIYAGNVIIGGAGVYVGNSNTWLRQVGAGSICAISTGTQVGSGGLYMFTDGNWLSGTPDTGIGRNAAGVLEINNGTSGTLRDLIIRNLNVDGSFTSDSGDITSDGSGNLTAVSFIGAGDSITFAGHDLADAVSALGFVMGASLSTICFDGNVSSDGSGNVDCNSLTATTVSGETMVLVPQGSAPASPFAGQIYFDGTHFWGYNGSAWVQLDN